MAELYKLRNQIRHYEWGSPNCIPRLLGVPGDGRPWAELWMGCHPGAPSMISGPQAADTSLAGLVATDPRRYLGERAARKYGALPFLFKLLAAEQPLSIQAHPGAAQAREGFERENAAALPPDAPTRSYKDPNHKPEMIAALSPFVGMCGFRDPAEIRRLLAEFLAPPAAAPLRESLAPLEQALAHGDPAPALRNFLAALLGLPPAAGAALTEYVLSIREPPPPAPHSPSPAPLSLMRQFARLHPGDPAVIAPLYLNVFRLEPGEAVFLKTGTLHAYVRGFGVELMANSDNVLRGGLTAKHVDVAELIKALDFSPSQPRIIRPQSPCFTYPAPCEEFSLSVVRGSGGAAAFAAPCPSICIVTEGEAVFSGGGADTALRQGESAFVPPGEGLTLRGRFTLYAASCPGTP